MGEKISVIVPVYNKEKYLYKTLTSVLEQTADNWELIVVDDGSTDNSPQICDEFAKKDSRIKVFHKENSGVSDTRNFGIHNSTVDYIAFLDADDYIANNMIEAVSVAISNCKPDLIEFGWKYDSFGEISENNSHSHQKETLFNKEYIYENIIPQLINIEPRDDKFIYDFSWNKVFKKESIDSNNVMFDSDRKNWEDRLFIVDFLRFCNSIYFLAESLYYQVNVPNSLSRRFDSRIFYSILDNYECYKKWYGDIYNMNTDYSLKYWGNNINNQIMTLFRLMFDGKISENDIRELINQIIDNKQVIFWMQQENDIPADCKKAFLSGNLEDTYNSYCSVIKKEMKQNNINNKISRFKGVVRRLLK